MTGRHITTQEAKQELARALVTAVLAIFVAVVSFSLGMKVAETTMEQGKGGEAETAR